jgi:hypothetical protein
MPTSDDAVMIRLLHGEATEMRELQRVIEEAPAMVNSRRDLSVEAEDRLP